MKTEWQTKTFGEVCKFVRGPFGGSLKKSIFVESGFAVYEQQHAIYNQFTDIRYFIDEVKFNEMRRFELSPGDLIMSCSGTMGRVARVPDGIERGIINQALLKLSPSNAVAVDFLKYWMDSPSFQEGLQAQAGGAAIQNVASVGVLKEIKILLPTIAEQQRIVAILDEAFDGIATAKSNAEKNLKNARELFESYLQSVFTQRGDGWIEHQLGSIAEVQSGGTPLIAKKEYWNGDIPWYSSGELNEIFTVEPERKVTSTGIEKSNAKKFPKGSLLIGMYDTAALKMSILDRDGAFNQAIAGVKPNNQIDVEFVLHAINAIKPKLLLERRGVRQKNLSLGKIKEIAIPFPTVAEQKVVVAKLREVMKETKQLESIYQQKITALDELKKSLLHKAFSGQL